MHQRFPCSEDLETSQTLTGAKSQEFFPLVVQQQTEEVLIGGNAGCRTKGQQN